MPDRGSIPRRGEYFFAFAKCVSFFFTVEQCKSADKNTQSPAHGGFFLLLQTCSAAFEVWLQKRFEKHPLMDAALHEEGDLWSSYSRSEAFGHLKYNDPIVTNFDLFYY